MKLRRITLVIMLIATVVVACWLFNTEKTLHCTQITSFRIAVFSMEPHIEERPVPLVYDKQFGIPIRVFLAVSLLSVFIFPWASVFTGRRRGVICIISGVSVYICGVVLASILAGERFSYLFQVTILPAVMLYALAAINLEITQ